MHDYDHNTTTQLHLRITDRRRGAYATAVQPRRAVIGTFGEYWARRRARAQANKA